MNFGPADIDHSDVPTYRRTADAFRSNDLEAVAQTIHDEVAWHFPGNTWLAREIHGRDAQRAHEEIQYGIGDAFRAWPVDRALVLCT